MEQYQKNENESKLVLELYEDCERANYNRIKKSLEDNEFSSRTVDVAIRKCIRNRKRERNEYHDSLNLLLQYVNVNFRNPNEENSTIFMAVCRISDVSLIDLLLGFDYTQNHCHPSMKLDLQIKDENGRNFLHYLVNKENQEEEACEVFDRFLDLGNHSDLKNEEIPEFLENCDERESKEANNKKYSNNSNNSYTNSIIQNYNLNITQELNVEDKDGYTPLSISLLIGWVTLSRKFLQCKIKTNSLIKTNCNNLIHLAVIGKNLNCIKLILSYSTLEDLRHKNKEGLTPRDLARNLKLNYYSKIIENFEENYLNPNFIKIFCHNNIQVNYILEKFYLEEYQETLLLLNQLKINQSILSKDHKNLNIEWNIFITKYYIKLNTNSTNENKINKTYKLSPESILSKFIEVRDQKNSDKNNCLYEFKKFFENVNLIENFDEETTAIDILIFNKGIFYFKLGDFIQTLKIFSDYLKNGFTYNDTLYYKWFLYINISFILIEGLSNLKYTKLVNLIIEKIEEFLFTHIRTKKDEISFSTDLVCIKDYLNFNEIINQFSPTWDESFCMVNLLKALNNLFEMKTDSAKSNLKEFKRLYKTCNYRQEVKVIDLMYNLYSCLKIKIFYIDNSFSKCFKKMNNIFKITQQINLQINDTKIDQQFNHNEYLLYYLNTMGILNLKLKKYFAAEVFFKLGISHFKKIYTLLEVDNFDFSIRLNYIYNFKYNLGLCYFYQKKYEKAFIYFREVSKNKNMNMNIFLWYRLGLCLLEIELQEIRKNKIMRNDLITKVAGYENMNKIVPIEDDLINDTNLNLNFIDDDDTSVNNLSFINKRIILQNNFNHSLGSLRKVYDAINYFKQVLLLECQNVNINSRLNEKKELNEIYNFYFDKRSAYMDNSYNDEPFEKTHPKIKSLNLIITSTYLNLVFALSLCENWTELIYFCDQFEQSPHSKKDKETQYKFNNFKIEALINLRQFEKALEIIKSETLSLNNNDFRGHFFNKTNCQIYNDVSYKIAINVNLIKIHFISNNFIEAEKLINNLINLLNGNNSLPSKISNLPTFIQNLLIYSNLIKGNQEVVLNLIKYRKNNLIGNFNVENK